MSNTNEIVAHFLETIGSIWGRELGKHASLVYMRIARQYSPKQVGKACEWLLCKSQQMPTPADLSAVLLEGSRRLGAHSTYVPPEVEVASVEVARKAVEEFFRRTGQKRGKK